MKLISVLMSTYKEPIEYVNLSIDSILVQTYTNLEYIILLDDPDNIEMIDFLKHKSKEDSRIKVIINSQNLGLVNSLNNGLKYCKGNIVARMDADDISLDDRLEMQLAYMEKNDLDIVGGAYERFVDEKIEGDILYFPSTSKECKERLKKGNCIPHPAWLVKKNVYETCMGYRSINCCEDYDFILRAVQQGYRVGNYPNCVIRYRYNQNSISRKGFAEQNVITHFLADCFRKDIIPSIEEYKEYLNSNVCQKKINEENKMEKLKTEYKQSKKLFQKITCLIKIGLFPLFWKKLLR